MRADAQRRPFRAWALVGARLTVMVALAPVALLLLVALPFGLVPGPAAIVTGRATRTFIAAVGRLLQVRLPRQSRPSVRDALWLVVHSLSGVVIAAAALLLWWAAAAFGADVVFPLGVFALPVIGTLAITWMAVPALLRCLAAMATAVLVNPRRSGDWGLGAARVGAAVLLAPISVLLLALLLAGLALVPLLGLGLPVVAMAIADMRRFVAVTSRLLGMSPARAYTSQPGPSWRALVAALRDRQNLRDVNWLCVHGALGAFVFAAGAVLVQTAVMRAEPGAIGRIALLPTIGIVLIVVLAVALTMRSFAGLARVLLTAPPSAALARRVAELAESRAATVDAQAAELRRIERDLHDGAQARLAAVRMTLGLAAQTMQADPERAAALVAEAQADAGKALGELRDLVRGIHPPVLADRGLAGGLEAAALLCPVPVHVAVALDGRPQAPVESALYFAATEALANIGRHAGARSAWLRVDHADGVLRVVVGDDGRGGADPRRGTGLRGIERRLAAFDGTLTVASPPGGPTELTMEVPCQLNFASSSPRTTSSSATG